MLLILIALGACAASNSPGMKKISETTVGDDLRISLSSPDGKLKNGDQTIRLKFTDGSGNPVEIKAASLNFNMPAMGSMAEMNDSAVLRTTQTPGEFTGEVSLQMAGEWIAQISYEGKKTGKTTMKVTAY